MATALGVWNLGNNFNVPTNSFQFLPLNVSNTTNFVRPNEDYWNTATPVSNKIKLHLNQPYLVIPTVVWNVQAAGARELSLNLHYTYTYQGSPGVYDDMYRCQTLPGAAGSYVEMTASQVVVPRLPDTATNVEVSLQVQVWQNSGSTVQAIGLSSVAVYELDVVEEV